MQHTLVVLVEDKPGVLNRVASLFRRRVFNIESLSVPVLHEMFKKYFPETRYTVVTLTPEATGAAR